MAVTAADLQIKFSSDTRAAEAGIDRMGSKVKGLGGVMQTALGTAGGFLLGGAIGAMVGGFGSLVKGALDFEAGMANVNSIAQLTDGQLKTLSASVNDLATKTAQAPQTLAAGLYDIYSSGFQGAQALDVLEASANAATAGLTTTDVAARAITSVMNAYGQETYSAAEVSDVLFQTVNDGVISFEQLANNLGNTLPMANALGIGVQQLGAAYAQMTLQGVSAAQSETQIASLMKAAANPTDDLTAATRAYGYETTQALLAAEGMPGLLKAIDKAAGGNSETMYDLLGTQEAVNAATILGADGAKAYTDELERMEHASGATNKALTKQSKSSAFAMKQAKIAFQQAATVLVGALSPAIQLVARGVAFLATNALTPAIELFGRILDPIGRFAGLLREAFGSGQGVADLFNVLFGPGGSFANAPQFIQDTANALLTIADSVGDVVAAFRVGGLDAVGDVIAEEIGNVVDSLGTIAGGVVDVVIDTTVDVVGEIRDLLERGVLAFIGYAGYSTGDPMLAGLGGVGIGTGAPDLTIDIVVDGLVKLAGDLTDLGGAIERELGLAASEGDIEQAREAGRQAGKDLAQAVQKGLADGADDPGGAAAPGNEMSWTQKIKNLLTWEPSFFADDQATFFDEAFAWANGVGVGINDKITEGLSNAFNGTESFNMMTGTSTTSGGLAGLQETINKPFEDFNQGFDEAAQGVYNTVSAGVTLIKDAFGLITGIGEPTLPALVQDAAGFLQPFENLANGLMRVAGLLDSAWGVMQAVLGKIGGGGGDPGAQARQNKDSLDFSPLGDLGKQGDQLRPQELEQFVDVTAVYRLVGTEPAGGVQALVSGAIGGVGGGGMGAGFTAGAAMLDGVDVDVPVTVKLDLDSSAYDAALAAATGAGQAFAGQTWMARFDLDIGAVAAGYTEAFGWGTVWGGSTFTGIFAADNGGVAVAYSEAFGWGSTWAAQTFTARFSVDTSGITAAVGVAQTAAAQIAAIMPHSPAREGPLSEPIKFDWIADEMRGAMAKMGPAAEAGMGAVADRLGRGVGFDFAGRGVYGSDGGGAVSHSVTVNINAPVYGVDDLENVVVDAITSKVIPGLTIALGRRNRALGHQR